MELELGRTSVLKLDELPQGCISHILSFTTPKDTCVCSAISTAFHSAAESDSVWNQFLPSDYQGVLSRAADHVRFSSKKNLFFQLCRSLLVDEGKSSFMLEKSTGYKCFMLSSEKLNIVWGDTPQYWTWHPLPQSRFSMVAELMNVCWLNVDGTVRSGELQANTVYVAYLIYTFSPHSFGFDTKHQEAMVKIADEVICDEILYLKRVVRQPRFEEVKYFPRLRDDNWMEIGLGEFLNEYRVEEEIKVVFREIKILYWKKGLIIEGIEFRPKQ
ncbi:F-box protein PP2-B1 [Zostera marina]|uniref:F-box protein PP2-B1 n=1 Tax=Zostera marina TaxID=29655 RepID=A0A0K9PUI9_ZOSMR|nr:F-box protein PP2-B1 [Zostera marina]